MLTPAQYQTLKADIDGDPVLSAFPNNSDGAWEIAKLYNLTAVPDWTVWKTQVLQDEIMQNGFNWTQVDNLTVGKSRIWEWLFNNSARAINPSKTNVRDGIIECWSGTAERLAVQAAVFAHCKRLATRFEKLFSTGTGSVASPATMAVAGPLSYQDVELARNS